MLAMMFQVLKQTVSMGGGVEQNLTFYVVQVSTGWRQGHELNALVRYLGRKRAVRPWEPGACW